MLVLYLFCYIFSFYISVFPTSILIAIPLYAEIFSNKSYLDEYLNLFSYRFFRYLIYCLLLVNILAVFLPTFYLTLDWSFLRVSIMQCVHFLCALPLFVWLKKKNYSIVEIEEAIITCFCLQTCIQLLAFGNGAVKQFVRLCNRFEPDKLSGIGSNVRGMALSAATTYHLSLSYGVCFILWVKRCLNNRISVLHIIKGILIFCGIFFAGRSGFVAVGLSGFYFVFTKKIKIKYKVKCLVVILIFIIIFGSALQLFFPSVFSNVINNLIPYAFEFIYSKIDSGKAQTASTNQLMQMWTERNFNFYEFLFGSGKYTSSDGHYYMRVDPGVLRNMLFLGFWGYLFLIFYQLILTPFYSKKIDPNERFFLFVLFLFIFLLDFKGVTVALNKFMFSLSLLFSYCYLILNKKQVICE